MRSATNLRSALNSNPDAEPRQVIVHVISRRDKLEPVGAASTSFLWLYYWSSLPRDPTSSPLSLENRAYTASVTPRDRSCLTLTIPYSNSHFHLILVLSILVFWRKHLRHRLTISTYCPERSDRRTLLLRVMPDPPIPPRGCGSPSQRESGGPPQEVDLSSYDSVLPVDLKGKGKAVETDSLPDNSWSPLAPEPDDDDQDDEVAECAICLMAIELPSDVDQEEIGSIACGTMPHTFHLPCLLSWSKQQTTCPKDRMPFVQINVLSRLGGPIIRNIKVVPRIYGTTDNVAEATILDDAAEFSDVTECMICNETYNEDTMLLCDICDGGYHIFCLGLDTIPAGDWFCPQCGGDQPGVMAPRPAETLDTDDVPLRYQTLTHARTAGSRRDAARRNAHHRSTQGSTAPPQRQSRLMVAIRREMAAVRRQRMLDLRYGPGFDAATEEAAGLRRLGNQAYTRMYRAGRYGEASRAHYGSSPSRSASDAGSLDCEAQAEFVGSAHALAMSVFTADAMNRRVASARGTSSPTRHPHRGSPSPTRSREDDQLAAIWRQFDIMRSLHGPQPRVSGPPSSPSRLPTRTTNSAVRGSSPRSPFAGHSSSAASSAITGPSAASSANGSSAGQVKVYKPPSLRKRDRDQRDRESRFVDQGSASAGVEQLLSQPTLNPQPVDSHPLSILRQPTLVPSSSPAICSTELSPSPQLSLLRQPNLPSFRSVHRNGPAHGPPQPASPFPDQLMYSPLSPAHSPHAASPTLTCASPQSPPPTFHLEVSSLIGPTSSALPSRTRSSRVDRRTVSQHFAPASPSMSPEPSGGALHSESSDEPEDNDGTASASSTSRTGTDQRRRWKRRATSVGSVAAATDLPPTSKRFLFPIVKSVLDPLWHSQRQVIQEGVQRPALTRDEYKTLAKSATAAAVAYAKQAIRGGGIVETEEVRRHVRDVVSRSIGE